MRNIRFEYKITALYLIIGCLWILFSDKILLSFFEDSRILTEMQTYKGWFYVLITSTLLFFLLKNHLVAMRAARQKAIENDRLKTAFLQNISHEIRTPMNGIIGFAGLLNGENLTDKQKKQYLDIIIKSSDQLLKIVNEVLDISMIESGSTVVESNKVNLNKLMDEVYQSFLPFIKNEIEFKVQKEFTQETYILTDEAKLKQILRNLLSNAIKFTENGSVKFGYNLIENSLEFFVKDTGIGIDKKINNNVFERFFQTEKGTKKLYEGVGLGLAICKGNIDLMQGKIWYDSTPDKGSVFYFSIPYSPVEKDIQSIKNELESKNPRDFTILVVEDEESNYLYIKEIFKGLGINVIHAVNGKEAVDICFNISKIDLILMDIKMPVMNGYEATKLIREKYPDLPIIAQSAFALREEREMAINAGCNEYISKPFRKEQLIAMLNSFN